MTRFLIVMMAFSLCLGPHLVRTGFGEITEQPIVISVKEIRDGHVLFQPIIPASFGGYLQGELDGKVNKCYVTEKVKGVLDGDTIRVIVLKCGKATIDVEGIGFQ